MLDEYFKSLARDYLFCIDMMESTDHDPDIRRELFAQRGLIHDELIRVLGSDYGRPFDMRSWCRQLLSA